MKRQRFQTCALVLALNGLTGWALKAETVVLKGSVQTLDGAALAARITILRGSPKAGIETHDTDPDGSFSISTSGPGIQVVRAGANGYAGSEIIVSPRGSLSSLHFRLAELRPVEGTVRSHTGTVQAGVPVRIRYLDSRRRMRMDEDVEAVTDENGSFTLLAAGDGGGRFVVDALPDDWVSTPSAILGTGAVARSGAVPGDDAAIRNVLIELRSRGARISGSVISPAGESLPDIIVRAVVRTVPDRVDDVDSPGSGIEVTPGGVADKPSAQLFTKIVETDGQGTYTIRGLPPGSLTLTARSIGEKPTVRTLQLSDGEAATVNFTLLKPVVTTRPKRMAPVPPPPPEP